LSADKRALRIGVGGPVGTGKSSLVATLCRAFAGELELGVVTNDIYTDEDARFLRSEGVLPDGRIQAVQTGCCPHTAIRDDISANLDAVDELERTQGPLAVVFVESGGDNLTAAFSPALADTQIFVLDCAGGDDVPRKGGPGVARSDMLVINKTDLAPLVGANVEVMIGDATAQRDGRPVIAVSLRDGHSVAPLTDWVRAQLDSWLEGSLESIDPGPPAPHVHRHEHTH
jgi:urease accessory protein